MFIATLAALTVPPPPAHDAARTDIVSFTAGKLSCADGAVPSDRLIAPAPVLLTRYGVAASGATALPSYRYRFAIDATGHPASMRRDRVGSSGVYIDASDLAPALAASHFPANAPRTGCTIRYTVSLMPIETAPMPLLYELASRPATSSRFPALSDRVRPEGSTCPAEPGQYRRRNLPAFEKLPPPPGGSSWVYLSFDVDRAGRPRDARVRGSSGDAALNAAGLRALRDNRYAPGPGYRGCTYHFGHTARPVRWTPQLPAGTPADNGEQPGCAVDPKSIAGLLNGTAYPRPFWQRQVEGVAAVSFATAPWGATGDVTVLASEPDEVFGEVARDAFNNARVAPSDTGRRGCVRHVRFRLPPPR